MLLGPSKQLCSYENNKNNFESIVVIDSGISNWKVLMMNVDGKLRKYMYKIEFLI